MAREKNFYEILEVPFGASDAKIKHKYREFSLKSHPDFVDGSPQEKEANERQIELNAAYDTLLNPEKRKEYDERVRPALKYEQEVKDRGDSVSDYYDIQRKLEELWKWIFGFQSSAVDVAWSSYFAQSHHKSLVPPRTSNEVKSEIHIPWRSRE